MTNHTFVTFLFCVAACDQGLEVQTRSAEVQTAGCTHGVCVDGSPLAPSCTPCTATICQHDPFCCEVAWDALCVSEADSLCGNTCQTSCSVGAVPVVDFAGWDKRLPLPLGREVLVSGPWTSPKLMSVTVFQEQPNQAVLLVGGLHDLGEFFSLVGIPVNTLIVGIGGAPGKCTGGGPIGPVGLCPQGGPIGAPEIDQIIAAASEQARTILDFRPVCDIQPVFLEPPM